MKVDAKAIAGGLGLEAVPPVATELCRRHVSSFEAAIKSGAGTLVACTQEAALFTELHEASGASGEIRFVNIRESAGWSAEGDRSAPKMAALLALAGVAPPEPVPVVQYKSSGELLVIGPASAALAWAERLATQFSVTVLVTEALPSDELPVERRYAVYSGNDVRLRGHLGAFDVAWTQANPIDLEACTRCGACVRACPEQAIGLAFQVDLDRCKAHRACVAACGDVQAIDFGRAESARDDRFDLVLDLSREPLIRTPQPPQGYLAPGADPLDQALAAGRLAELVGEFEKPRFYAYNERLCAHGRSGISGCTRCVDVCSTAAITSDLAGNRVAVDSYLCMGCGACATVCPTGAMTYAYPRMADVGTRLRALLGAYRKAGGETPALLLHNTEETKERIARMSRGGRGLPAHVIPLEMLHVASVGPDLMLGALALGASQLAIVCSGAEAAEYRDALEREVRVCTTLLEALGYGRGRLHVIEAGDTAALEQAVWALPRCGEMPPATFNLSNEKRRTLDYVLDHLARHAPAHDDVIPLEAGAPFGAVAVDREKCTLCLACVGACPSNAHLDSKESPALRFVERNCVQCGLCAKTCPEDAITLVPRLSLTDDAKRAVVLNETEPFNCVRCTKPFGTRQMIDNMLSRLTGHAMFASPAQLKRLQMCADCRVLDMMSEREGASIFEYPTPTVKD
jgi:ferredoxin